MIPLVLSKTAKIFKSWRHTLIHSSMMIVIDIERIWFVVTMWVLVLELIRIGLSGIVWNCCCARLVFSPIITAKFDSKLSGVISWQMPTLSKCLPYTSWLKLQVVCQTHTWCFNRTRLDGTRMCQQSHYLSKSVCYNSKLEFGTFHAKCISIPWMDTIVWCQLY